MAKFKSLVKPNLGFKTRSGMCLQMAQGIVGAPVAHRSATDAANATKHRHATRTMPDAIAVLWFDHWGAYDDGNGPYHGRPVGASGNWGHVVDYIPGVGFASSSPVFGDYSAPYIYESIGEVESAFNCSFRFWSEDINTLRVCEPIEERDRNKPVEYITRDTNGRKAKQVLPAGANRMLEFTDAGSTAMTTEPGDHQLAAEVRVKGEPGSVVRITCYRYVWDDKAKKYSSKVYINEGSVTVGDNGLGYETMPIANRLPKDNSRLGLEARITSGKKSVEVDRFAVKGHRWEA